MFEPRDTGVHDSYLLGETPEGAGVLVPEGVDLTLHAGKALREGVAVALRLHPAAHRPQLPPHGDQPGESSEDAGDGGQDRSDVLHYWPPPPDVGAGAGAGSWATCAAAAAPGSSFGSAGAAGSDSGSGCAGVSGVPVAAEWRPVGAEPFP